MFPVSVCLFLRSVREEDVAGEGGVHVPVDVWCSAQEDEPRLVPRPQVQDGAVGGWGPVRDALRPDGRHHLFVDNQINSSLETSACTVKIMSAAAHTMDSD